MRRLAFVLAVLLVCLPLTVFAEENEVIVGIDDENIVYMGRWEKTDGGLMRGAFECGLVLRFTGTAIRLNGDASGTALLAIDGGEVKEKNLTKNAVLFSGLSDGEHTLELYAAAQKTFPSIGGFALGKDGKTVNVLYCESKTSSTHFEISLLRTAAAVNTAKRKRSALKPFFPPSACRPSHGNAGGGQTDTHPVRSWILPGIRSSGFPVWQFHERHEDTRQSHGHLPDRYR